MSDFDLTIQEDPPEEVVCTCGMVLKHQYYGSRKDLKSLNDQIIQFHEQMGHPQWQ